VALALWAGRGRSAVRVATLSSAGALRSFAPGCRGVSLSLPVWTVAGQMRAPPGPAGGARPGESRTAPAQRGPRSAAADRRRGPRRRVRASTRAARGLQGPCRAHAGPMRGDSAPMQGRCSAHAGPTQGPIQRPCRADAAPMQGRLRGR
jgi:hypothetical protein